MSEAAGGLEVLHGNSPDNTMEAEEDKGRRNKQAEGLPREEEAIEGGPIDKDKGTTKEAGFV